MTCCSHPGRGDVYFPFRCGRDGGTGSPDFVVRDGKMPPSLLTERMSEMV